MRENSPSAGQGEPFFITRGAVITPDDLTLPNWPERAKAAGLTTLALHPTPGRVMEFVRSEAGQAFLERCRALDLAVEYELHAMRELLPREEFARHPEIFRMNDAGERTPDANLCVHSPAALEIAAARAVAIGRVLRPTTGRYFLWGDDGAPWCRCPQCRPLTDADQALLLENHLLAALRRLDPNARLAHLAYLNTLAAPAQVKPEPGVFLEYAPIRRRHDLPYSEQTSPDTPDPVQALADNLAVFGNKDAQVLEYWLDVSRYSGWKRPAVPIPWRPSVFRADAGLYAAHGIQHLTSFAVWIDADYLARWGEPPLKEYGAVLAETGERLRRERVMQELVAETERLGLYRVSQETD